ncbi:dynein light chain roadblock-type 2 [Drosophila grimshawi]|uniref:Dynein light chain roadblock n=1 Tax=Drosophila grimshawi TaxID=7222 RepID=B4JQZ5_DROGR|nr:dynein light chain roadblock-type 2 [Drosophila grimshawi]EDV99325.1 GH13788 [Drosophila grimshawi]
MSAEVEEMLKRFQNVKNVVGILVVDNDGIVIKSTLDNQTAVHYAGIMRTLTEKARQVILDLDATNEFTSMRMRTSYFEIILMPQDNYIIVVIQNPCD